jgi:hypothetical protein
LLRAPGCKRRARHKHHTQNFITFINHSFTMRGFT